MHDLVRWLDHLRHFLAWGFAISNWFTNASEQIIATIIAAGISYLVWPKLRRRVDAWVGGHFRHHHDAIKATLDEHHDRILASVKEHIAAKEHASVEPVHGSAEAPQEGTTLLDGGGVPRPGTGDPGGA